MTMDARNNIETILNSVQDNNTKIKYLTYYTQYFFKLVYQISLCNT